ncbi:MAG: chemotaxis protein CheC [Firmicutes bacterium]|nr:chemotaxis protein CheC [Bacillota bacterium]
MFSPLQIDVLREVSNIGCGNAATALSNMLNKRIDMEIPSVNVLPLAQVPELLGGAELLVTGVFFQALGGLPCSILWLLEQESVGKLLSLLFGMDIQSTPPYSSMEQSALMEVGNILSSSYLGALSSFTDLNFQLSVPALATDMAGAVLDIALMQLGSYSDHALVIKNSLRVGDESVEANFLLIPDLELVEKIFTSLGVSE